MSQFKFDDNIPIPEYQPFGGRRGSYKSKYGFLAELNLNQSVFVPVDRFKSSNLSQATTRYAKRLDRKFVTRKRTEHGVYGTRVWRTK
jgi:hypothetical protein